MAESKKTVDTGTEDGKKRADQDAGKARELMGRDVPDEKPNTQAGADRDTVYRPDENVDNEQNPEARKSPEHNTTDKQTPLTGRGSKEKAAARNIDDKSSDAETPGRDG